MSEVFSLNKQNHFRFGKSGKVGSIAWLRDKDAENASYLLLKMYALLAPDNIDFHRDATKEELAKLTLVYNIKYPCNPMIITKVHALLNAFRSFDNDKGIALFTCSCGNDFVMLESSLRLSCHFCRSKIDKKRRGELNNTKPFALDLNSISKVIPASEKKPTSFF